MNEKTKTWILGLGFTNQDVENIHFLTDSEGVSSWSWELEYWKAHDQRLKPLMRAVTNVLTQRGRRWKWVPPTYGSDGRLRTEGKWLIFPKARVEMPKKPEPSSREKELEEKMKILLQLLEEVEAKEKEEKAARTERARKAARARWDR